MNLLVYSSFNIIDRISYFQSKNPLNYEIYGDDVPQVQWVNYCIKNKNFGLFWMQIATATTKMMRYHIHFISDDQKEIKFLFDFEFENPGFVGVVN